MSSNLLLVAGPILGLADLRAFGPVRPLPALATAVGCQILVFYGYAYWWRPRIEPLLSAHSGDSPRMLATYQPTLSGRLMVLGSLVAIAGVLTAIFLAVQFVASRGATDPPPAV